MWCDVVTKKHKSSQCSWQSGDHSMLQPVAAYPFFAVCMATVEVKEETGRNELELLGQSSAARNAVGGNA